MSLPERAPGICKEAAHGDTVSLSYYFPATIPYLQFFKKIPARLKAHVPVISFILLHFVENVVLLEKADFLDGVPQIAISLCPLKKMPKGTMSIPLSKVLGLG